MTDTAPGPLLPLVIELAGPPKGKGAVRPTIRFGGKLNVFQPKPTKDYLAALKYVGQNVMEGCPPLSGPLAVSITAYIPIPAGMAKKHKTSALAGYLRPVTKPDLDNYCKAAGDALNGIVWVDDKQIVDLSIRKVYSDKPGLVIEVRRPQGYGVQYDADADAAGSYADAIEDLRGRHQAGDDQRKGVFAR